MSFQHVKTKGFCLFCCFQWILYCESCGRLAILNPAKWHLLSTCLGLILIVVWRTSESIGTLSCPDVGLVGSEAEKINENTKSEKKKQRENWTKLLGKRQTLERLEVWLKSWDNKNDTVYIGFNRAWSCGGKSCLWALKGKRARSCLLRLLCHQIL